MPPNSHTNFQSYTNCRFYVQIDGLTQAVFTELGGLALETEVFEYQEGGNNSYSHRLPGRAKVGNVSLKRGITQSNELFKWCRNITQGNMDKRNISVLMFDTEGTEVARWNFVKAFPVKWSGPQFQAEGHVTAIESLELAHEGLGTT
jgi:phage tail-like protein